MIKVVVVDDEKMIRDGIVYTMPWDELGIQVAGAAGDGQTALEMIREKKPNIVLTDVRMPGMDGIQLLKAVKEEIPNTKVVILSGYDEFQYARQAVKYGAEDFLVKPVNAVELKKLMEKLCCSFKEEIHDDLLKMHILLEIEDELEKYSTAIRLGNNRAAIYSIENMFIKDALKKLPVQGYQKLGIEIVNQIFMSLKEDGVELEEDFHSECLNSYMGLFSVTRLEELKNWMLAFIEKISGRVETKRGDCYRSVIKKALEYIDAYYYEDLSLQKLSEITHLNQSYFSHLFKKVKNESFRDYLNKVRIENAKKLLENDLYKVYEVSYMVGYSDYKYFSSVFKKTVGVSATEYSKVRSSKDF